MMFDNNEMLNNTKQAKHQLSRSPPGDDPTDKRAGDLTFYVMLPRSALPLLETRLKIC